MQGKKDDLTIVQRQVKVGKLENVHVGLEEGEPAYQIKLWRFRPATGVSPAFSSSH